MRTELTYAVDAMNHYNGGYEAAVAHVGDYHRQGGLSVEYFRKVIAFMLAVEYVNIGRVDMIAPKLRKRIIKAIRRKLPRVHSETSNWRLVYHDYLEGAAEARRAGMISHAKTELRCAGHVRRRYL